MGGKSSSTQTTNQTQKTEPYAGAKPGIDSLLGQLGGVNPGLTGTETGALDALQANASGGNPYAPKIGDVANTLLAGGPDRTGIVNDAYTQYRSFLDPIASGNLDPSKNPELMKYIGVAGDDVANRVNGMFASAGRDFSGAHANALGRGVTSATAPILYDAYNRANTDRISAADKLFSAGGTTGGLLAGLDQMKLGNQQAGIDASKAALTAKDSPLMATLAIEAQRRGIPLNNITSLLAPLMQAGQAFGTTTGSGTTTGTQQMSGVQQFLAIAQGLGSLFNANKPNQPVSMGSA